MFPGNPAQGKDAHQGAVLLYRPDTGEPMALINASALTEIRAAAASAVATACWPGRAPATWPSSGPACRPGRTRWRWPPPGRCRDPDRRADPGAGPGGGGLAGLAPLAGIPVVASSSAADAVAGAGIVVTATNSATPVVQDAWLAPGRTSTRSALPARHPRARPGDRGPRRVFTDSRESALAEAGTLGWPWPRARSAPGMSAPRSASCSPGRRPAVRRRRDHRVRVARPGRGGPGRRAGAYQNAAALGPRWLTVGTWGPWISDRGFRFLPGGHAC